MKLQQLQWAEPVQTPERRAEERQLTLMRVAMIHAHGHQELCLVCNISSRGLQARTYRPRRPGDVIAVEFKSGQIVGGTVTWVRQGRIGLQFNRPVDVDEVLAARWTGEKGHKPARPVRLKTDCPAIFRVGARRYGVRLRDISQAGAKLMTDKALGRSSGILFLPDLPHLEGIVRWQSDDQAGFAFNEPLAVPTLARWINDRTGGVRHAPETWTHPPQKSVAVGLHR